MTFMISSVELDKTMWQTIQTCVISSYESCGPPRQEEYMGGGGDSEQSVCVY